MLKNYILTGFAVTLATSSVIGSIARPGKLSPEAALAVIPPLGMVPLLLLSRASGEFGASAAIVTAYLLLDIFFTVRISGAFRIVLAMAAFALSLGMTVLGFPALAILSADFLACLFAFFCHFRHCSSMGRATRVRSMPDAVACGASMLTAIILLVLSCSYLALLCGRQSSAAVPWIFHIIADTAAAALFAVLYLRTVCGHQMYISQAKVCQMENRIMRRVPAPLEKGQEDVLKNLFQRIVEFMERERPYLDPDMSAALVAKAVYSNKTYVGRAILQYTGKNFCQFVNGYRVSHAMECFMGNPEMRVGQMALASGFRNKSSFNIAFKLVNDVSPAEWCAAYRQQMK